MYFKDGTAEPMEVRKLITSLCQLSKAIWLINVAEMNASTGIRKQSFALALCGGTTLFAGSEPARSSVERIRFKIDA
jgi:hypothetical protein